MAYGAKRPMGQGSERSGDDNRARGRSAVHAATIALPRGAVITGRVSDENGDPLARVQVYTMFFAPGSTRGQRMGMNAQTDDLGHFRL